MKKLIHFIGIIIILIIGILIVACDEEIPEYDKGYTSTVKYLSDLRFYGVFSRNTFDSYKTKLTFDGTNKMIYEYYNGTKFDFEIEIDEDHHHYRKRLWSNSSDDWTPWLSYSFNDDHGLTKLTIVENKGISPYIYTKE